MILVYLNLKDAWKQRDAMAEDVSLHVYSTYLL